ncbi:alpha/beta hydrolase [Williamsia sp. Leaf354]|uniref:alpha/beta fold hydrolase n=1 Tax=Williamsia sp. Leaf354 TaxID=1736349 RepID=UPI0006F377C8|nr:alpha/beta hydrolase [Williamsia sp. Leaf354]KQS00541.1 alpha/beta hydrolase [Williamsia sp. Leaf354]
MTTWTDTPTQTIDVGGVPFAYRELGPTGGVPVVFLHHFTATLDDWDPRIIDGVASAHHVITFDNRGVGGSGGKVPATIDQMAADAIAFIRALGLTEVDLFGFSLGGGVAQVITLRAPVLIRRIVLTGTGPRGGGGIDKMAGIVGGAYLKAALARQDPRNFLFFPRSSEGKKAAAAYFDRLAERRGDRDAKISLQARVAQLRAIVAGGRATPDDLSMITQPALVANGDNDVMVASEHSVELAARIPDARVIIYPRSGHGGIFQYHDEFVPEVLDFLGESVPTAPTTTTREGTRR